MTSLVPSPQTGPAAAVSPSPTGQGEQRHLEEQAAGVHESGPSTASPNVASSGSSATGAPTDSQAPNGEIATAAAEEANGEEGSNQGSSNDVQPAAAAAALGTDRQEPAFSQAQDEQEKPVETATRPETTAAAAERHEEGSSNTAPIAAEQQEEEVVVVEKEVEKEVEQQPQEGAVPPQPTPLYASASSPNAQAAQPRMTTQPSTSIMLLRDAIHEGAGHDEQQPEQQQP